VTSDPRVPNIGARKKNPKDSTSPLVRGEGRFRGCAKGESPEKRCKNDAGNQEVRGGKFGGKEADWRKKRGEKSRPSNETAFGEETINQRKRT